MSHVLTILLEPFTLDFMTRAILVSGLIGAMCGCLSCFVTLKGWSLLGDALSHAVVPGVAIAHMLGLPFTLGAFVAGMCASASISFIRSHTRLREDAVIGIVLCSYFALGLFIISVWPSNLNLKTFISGNLLTISKLDSYQLVGVAVFTLGVLLVKWKDLLLFLFDPNQARTIGLNVTALHYLLLMLLTITCVAAMQAVGAILVVGMLVTPGAVAYLLTDRFHKMLIISTLFGCFTALFGCYMSYMLATSAGGTIIVGQTALFLLVLTFAPKHGLLAGRRLVRAAMKESPESQPLFVTSDPV